jgi:TonB family protein
MEMRITADRWTPRRFSSQWTQALILNVDPAQLEKYDDAFVSFNNLPRGALRRGDHLVVESDKKGRTRVSINGIEMFTENKPGFFEVLLSTWIGDKPPSREFKSAILYELDQALIAQYEALQPSDKRTAAVAAWLHGGAVEEEAEGEQSSQQELLAAGQEPAAELPRQNVEPKSTAAAAASPMGAAPVAAAKPAVSPSASEAGKKAGSLAASVTVKDVVAKPKVLDKRPPVKEGKVLAMAPSSRSLPLEADEPAVDPAIFRLQQETLLKLYRSSIIKRALRQVEYPRSAVRRGHQGTVMLELTVDRGGKMVSLETATKTRYKSLNKAAIAAVYDAGSLPSVPAALEGKNITVSIPVKFTLQ